uniref:Uncharacterized protein n=1 Tax=Oryza barthii TaxID=65489 RepID=A0A0D3GNW0_9ORYZ
MNSSHPEPGNSHGDRPPVHLDIVANDFRGCTAHDEQRQDVPRDDRRVVAVEDGVDQRAEAQGHRDGGRHEVVPEQPVPGGGVGVGARARFGSAAATRRAGNCASTSAPASSALVVFFFSIGNRPRRPT